MDERITDVIIKLDNWLCNMRSSDGYCGPVVHWWQNSLSYTGVGYDWRYEGIVCGYLNLFDRTINRVWLNRAKQAANDLVANQIEECGNFRASNFEANPAVAGTPHEAACDMALLQLAKVLKRNLDSDWEKYYSAADQNIRLFLLGVLWDESLGYFKNSIKNESFVANKAATIIETLFAWTYLTQDEEYIEKYVWSSLEQIISCQVDDKNDSLYGAIDQSSNKGKLSGRFFPLYIARCIPSLLLGFNWSGSEKYLAAALRAGEFLVRHTDSDGSLPQVLYKNRKKNLYPKWIAGVGDVLRAFNLLMDYGLVTTKELIQTWLLAGVRNDGGIESAYGFASQINQKHPKNPPDFRDILSVCGWVDKAFRYFCEMATKEVQPMVQKSSIVERECLFNGMISKYKEDENGIRVYKDGIALYQWIKFKDWAETPVFPISQ